MKRCPECDSSSVSFTPVTTRWGVIVQGLDYRCHNCDYFWRDDEEIQCFECGGKLAKAGDVVVCRECGEEYTGQEQLLQPELTASEVVALVAEVGHGVLVLPDGRMFKLVATEVG